MGNSQSSQSSGQSVKPVIPPTATTSPWDLLRQAPSPSIFTPPSPSIFTPPSRPKGDPNVGVSISQANDCGSRCKIGVNKDLTLAEVTLTRDILGKQRPSFTKTPYPPSNLPTSAPSDCSRGCWYTPPFDNSKPAYKNMTSPADLLSVQASGWKNNGGDWNNAYNEQKSREDDQKKVIDKQNDDAAKKLADYVYVYNPSDSASVDVNTANFSALTRCFLVPTAPFQVGYTDTFGKTTTDTISIMSIYHPFPVRIENTQYDAVLQIGELCPKAIPGGRNKLVFLIPLVQSNVLDAGSDVVNKIASQLPALLNAQPDPVLGYPSVPGRPGATWKISDLLRDNRSFFTATNEDGTKLVIMQKPLGVSSGDLANIMRLPITKPTDAVPDLFPFTYRAYLDPDDSASCNAAKPKPAIPAPPPTPGTSRKTPAQVELEKKTDANIEIAKTFAWTFFGLVVVITGIWAAVYVVDWKSLDTILKQMGESLGRMAAGVRKSVGNTGDVAASIRRGTAKRARSGIEGTRRAFGNAFRGYSDEIGKTGIPGLPEDYRIEPEPRVADTVTRMVPRPLSPVPVVTNPLFNLKPKDEKTVSDLFTGPPTKMSDVTNPAFKSLDSFKKFQEKTRRKLPTEMTIRTPSPPSVALPEPKEAIEMITNPMLATTGRNTTRRASVRGPNYVSTFKKMIEQMEKLQKDKPGETTEFKKMMKPRRAQLAKEFERRLAQTRQAFEVANPGMTLSPVGEVALLPVQEMALERMMKSPEDRAKDLMKRAINKRKMKQVTAPVTRAAEQVFAPLAPPVEPVSLGLEVAAPPLPKTVKRRNVAPPTLPVAEPRQARQDRELEQLLSFQSPTTAAAASVPVMNTAHAPLPPMNPLIAASATARVKNDNKIFGSEAIRGRYGMNGGKRKKRRQQRLKTGRHT